MRKLSKTYKEVANEFLPVFLIEIGTDGEREKSAVESFAKHLDSFQTLTTEMELLALQKSREIDAEVLKAFFDEIGTERSREIIKKVFARHQHTKNESDILPTSEKSN